MIVNCPSPASSDDRTTSKSISDTVDGSHTFTIRGFSLAKGMGAGKYISSDTFSVGGYDWAVYFYPDGKSLEDNSTYVSVFIALASDGVDVRAKFKLTLLDQSGKDKHKVHSHFDRPRETGPYSLAKRGSMWGYKKFFRRMNLEGSDYVKDDCLIMNCTVGVVRTRVEAPKHYRISIPPSNMGQDFKVLLETEMAFDVRFIVGDEKFKAHKLVLAARSPVFRAQFFGLIGDPNMAVVEIADMEPSIFKAMLHFMYSDSLSDFHEILGSTSICTATIMIQHLLEAADRYGLDRLKLLCEARLCEVITVDTVATTLSLAEQHHSAELKAICLKFAAANLGVVMQSEGFKHVEESCPSLLCELLETIASVDERPNPMSSKKRSSSSIFGLNLGSDGGGPAESVNLHNRRVRRRV